MSPTNETQDVRTGGCLCDAIRYRITGPFNYVTHCHCAMCRRASGAPVVTWVTVPAARFEMTKGELKSYRSSDHGRRGFCPSCGAQVTCHSSRYPDFVDVTLGTLDDAGAIPARRHIWTSSRISWLHLDEQLPAYAEAGPDEPEP